MSHGKRHLLTRICGTGVAVASVQSHSFVRNTLLLIGYVVRFGQQVYHSFGQRSGYIIWRFYPRWTVRDNDVFGLENAVCCVDYCDVDNITVSGCI